jgi:hypothetical protein
LQSEQIRGAVAALSHRHRDVIHSCDGLATAFSALSGGVTAPATIGGRTSAVSDRRHAAANTVKILQTVPAGRTFFGARAHASSGRSS